MEVPLSGSAVGAVPDVAVGAPAPTGYRLVPWHDGLLDAHARTKFRSFRSEIDAVVFPCLGDLEGCRRLMREIRGKAGFLPAALTTSCTLAMAFVANASRIPRPARVRTGFDAPGGRAPDSPCPQARF
jgi:hypothetical protein